MAKDTFNIEMPNTVTRAAKVSGGGLPRDFSVIVPLTIDYRGCSGLEVAGWSMGNRVIAWQGAVKKLEPEFIRELSKSGLTVHARTAGNRVMSRDEHIAEYMAGGLPRVLAEIAVDDPARYSELMAEVDAKGRASAQ